MAGSGHRVIAWDRGSVLSAKGALCTAGHPYRFHYADFSVQTGAGERIGDLPLAGNSLESQLQRPLARQAGGASRTGSRGNPHSSGT